MCGEETNNLSNILYKKVTLTKETVWKKERDNIHYLIINQGIIIM